MVDRSLMTLSNYVIESHDDTFTRPDYLTVTWINYVHELINKLGQVNLTRYFLNIRCKADQIGLLAISPFDSLA